MQKEKKKGRSYASMFQKREDKDWRKDIVIQTPKNEVIQKEEEIEATIENKASYDNVIEDVIFDTDDNSTENEATEIKETTDHPKNTTQPKNDSLEKQVSNEIFNQMTAVENKKNTDVIPKDITTAIAENNRLLEKIEKLENNLDLSEKKNERTEFLYKELKEILISIGVSGELEMLEKAKTELNDNKIYIQQLENTVKENDNFITLLKNNLLSGVAQMFEQKPSEIMLIPENIPDETSKSEISELDRIVNYKKNGKSIKQIANLTNLSINKVEEILNSYEEELENVS